MDPVVQETLELAREALGPKVTAKMVRAALRTTSLEPVTKVPCPVCQQLGSIEEADDRGVLYRHPGRNFPCREIPTPAVVPAPVSREAQWLS